MSKDIWRDTVSEAFEDAGIVADDKQIDTVTSWVQGMHENYGMYSGSDCIPNPLRSEVAELKTQLRKEQDKRVCEECKGKGITHTYGGTFMSTSSCYKCRGEGKC